MPAPQLATLVTDVPAGDTWLHEIKFDGYRILAAMAGGECRLVSRNGNDWTGSYPRVANAVAGLDAESVLIDGEVVVFDEHGISRFQELQNARGSSRLHYMAFDLLHLDGEDLRRRPLLERKQLLKELLDTSKGDVIRYSDHVVGHGDAFYRQACTSGLEGIICKRADAKYTTGRNRDWLKVKCLNRQEFVIVGFTEPQGSRTGLGALLLGVYDDDVLRYAGKVGTGFTTKSLRELRKRLEPLERDTPAFENAPRGARARDVHWIEPELVAEIAFTEWTTDGSVRHPSFQGLREDKDPRSVVREEPAQGKGRAASASPKRSASKKAGTVKIAGVTITSPDRVVYEEQGVTKLELARYYESVMDRMLPHLLDRPLTLVRCPSGAHRQCFYQKHWGEGMPESVPRVMVEERDKTEPYMYIDGPTALMALVQLGVLEFHTWGSRRDRLDRPDLLIFDLDPDEALPWAPVQEASLRLRDRLKELGLTSFAKVTGGKGVHVVAPLARRAGWDEVKDFAEAIARELVKAEPKRYTVTIAKKARTGKIFVDYLRNAPNSTAIAAFSTRNREGAPIAAPISWRELEKASSLPRYTMRKLPGQADPWPGWRELKQSVTAAMRREVGLR